MNLRILSLLAATALVAACSSTPQQTAATSGGGTAAAAAPAPTPGPVPGSQADLVASAGDRVFFDFDKSALKDDAKATLEKQATWLKKYPQVTIQIEGHCDERGTREYNLALGERRASAAKNYLISNGIDAGRLSTISYGKERPIALGHDEAAWAQNRVSISIVKGGPAS